jgi:hypothetical protein
MYFAGKNKPKILGEQNQEEINIEVAHTVIHHSNNVSIPIFDMSSRTVYSIVQKYRSRKEYIKNLIRMKNVRLGGSWESRN